MTEHVDEVVAALARIRSWGEGRQWAGYDPYDALNSPLAPVLTLGTPIGRRLLTQAVKLSPVNLRPALGIRPAHNAKAVGLVASAYARLGRGDAAGDAATEARQWLRWLLAHPSPGADLAWGYHFPVQTRVLAYPRGCPNAIATSFVAQALLDGVELLCDDEWRSAVERSIDFLCRHLLVRSARPYFAYIEKDESLVHNANLLCCAVIARASQVVGVDDEREEIVRAAVATTLAAQHDDGSWPYAEGSHGWIDNFHTGYVLESISNCLRLVPEARKPLQAGVDYWRRELMLADGTPKYSSENLYPLDSHCHAQAIETWLAVASFVPDAIERAKDVAARLFERMLHRDGHVRFQVRRFWTNSVPFVRWTTAPTFRALARLVLVLRTDHMTTSDYPEKLECGSG